MAKTGARILIDTLLAHGVDTVFGYPGGAILPVYDELYKHSDRIHHILTSHEQGAAHAADGYARVSGKVGVCLATSGPGATNLTTGIATAYMDSSPVVYITANVVSSQIGTDSFQEVDIVGITMPVTKYNWFVRSTEELAPTLHKAFTLAVSDRPGPVLVDVPKDVLQRAIEIGELPFYTQSSQQSCADPAQDYLAQHEEELKNALSLISQSKRPFILLGGGVMRSGAYEEIQTLAERLRCPVACTLLGLGAFPADHPQYAGNFGMHGNRQANIASSNADLFIAVGTRFNDRISSDAKKFLSGTKLLHIDIDAAEIGKNISAHHALVGDAAVVLRALLGRLPAQNRDGEWLRESLFEKFEKNELGDCRELAPAPVLRALRKTFGEDALITTDVGQHQMWVAQYVPFNKPNTLVTSGGLGTMGFGLGAAIGAAAGQPERRVILVTGDGSFRMNLTELSTAVAEGMPIVVLIMNNGVLGMVRQWQTLFYGNRYSQTTLERGPDFALLAQAYGMKSFTPQSFDEYEQALTWCRENPVPVLIDCRIGQDEMVTPMVAPGSKLTDFIL